MSIRKRLFGLALATSIIAASSVTAFAATEADVIKALKDANVPETYIIKAENYLKTVDLTEAQATSVNAEVKKAADIMKKENVTDVSKLSSASKDAVLNSVKAAATAANLNVNIVKNAAGVNEISLTNASGQEVLRLAANEATMKKTGSNATLVFAIGGMLVIAAAGSVFVARKSLA